MTKDQRGTDNKLGAQPSEKKIKTLSFASSANNHFVPLKFEYKPPQRTAPVGPANNARPSQKPNVAQPPYVYKFPKTLKSGSDRQTPRMGNSQKQNNPERKVKSMSSNHVSPQRPASPRIPPEQNYPTSKSGSGGKKIITLLVILILIMFAAFGYLYWKFETTLNGFANGSASYPSVVAQSNSAPINSAIQTAGQPLSNPQAPAQIPVQPIDNIFYQHATVVGANKCAPLLSQLGNDMVSSGRAKTHAVVKQEGHGLDSIQLLSGISLNLFDNQTTPAAGVIYGVSGQEGCEGGYVRVQNIPQSCSALQQSAFSQFTILDNLNDSLVLASPDDSRKLMLLPAVNHCTIIIVSQ